jgi:N-acetylmuramoyl-L-alanine amidase
VSDWHTVKRGEVLQHIASDEGFFDPDSIWNAPENADLRKQRPDPNVLVEGDRIFIPDKTPKEVSVASGELHLFELETGKLVLRLRVLDSGGTPVANELCEITLPDAPPVGTTDEKGHVECPVNIAPGAKRPLDGGINFFNPDLRLVFHLKVGDLDHEDTPTGQQARLNNLGYFAGSDPPPDESTKDKDLTPEDLELRQQFRWAIEEFQCDQGVVPQTGKMDKKTQELLVKEHGS